MPVRVAGLKRHRESLCRLQPQLGYRPERQCPGMGRQRLGELGDGTSISRATPVRLEGLSGIRDIAPGSSYTIALTGDGTVLAWGENYGGWLGDGTGTNRLQPVAVKGLDHVTAIATGEGISFAARDDGTVVVLGPEQRRADRQRRQGPESLQAGKGRRPANITYNLPSGPSMYWASVTTGACGPGATTSSARWASARWTIIRTRR